MMNSAMSSELAYATNDAAFRRMQREIEAAYPHGELVALSGGHVVAHADSPVLLRQALAKLELQNDDIFVVRAGETYVDRAVIFL